MEFADRVHVAFARSRRSDISGFPGPVSPTVAPYPLLTFLRLRQPQAPRALRRRCRSSVDPAVRHQRPDDPRHLVGQRDRDQHARLPGQHARQPGSAGAPLTAAALAAELAPRISSRRKLRSPILVVRPSRSLPPLECWRGVSPSQAAKSRPRRNVSAPAPAPPARWRRRPDAGDGHQPPGERVGLGPSGDLDVQDGDLGLQRLQGLRQHLQHRSRLRRQIGRGIAHQLDQLGAFSTPWRTTMPNSARWPRRALISWVRWRTSRSRVRKTTPPPAPRRSSAPRTAWSAAAPPRRSPRRRPYRSSAASRTA